MRTSILVQTSGFDGPLQPFYDGLECETPLQVACKLRVCTLPQNGDGALDLISVLTEGDVRLLESLCLVGVVPAVTRYALAPYPCAVRLRAAAFVASLVFTGDSTLHMFVACQVRPSVLSLLCGLCGC